MRQTCSLRKLRMVAAMLAATILASCTGTNPATEVTAPTPVPKTTPPVLNEIAGRGPSVYPDPRRSFPGADEALDVDEITRATRDGGINDPVPGTYLYESIQERHTIDQQGRPIDLPDELRTRTTERRLEIIALRQDDTETEFAFRSSEGDERELVHTWRERWTLADVHMTHLWGCTVNPPLLLLRFPLHADDYPEQETAYGEGCDPRTQPPQYRIRVLGQEQVRAMGQEWPTWRIQRREPSRPPRETIETLWMSPELGIPIRRVAELTGGGGTSIYTDTLKSM